MKIRFTYVLEFKVLEGDDEDKVIEIIQREMSEDSNENPYRVGRIDIIDDEKEEVESEEE